MKTGKNTPKTIVCLDENIDHLWTMQRAMKRQLRVINAAHRNSVALRLKAYEDGVPGSTEGFYGPVMTLKSLAEGLKSLAGHIEQFSDVLLAHQPEDWK